MMKKLLLIGIFAFLLPQYANAAVFLEHVTSAGTEPEDCSVYSSETGWCYSYPTDEIDFDPYYVNTNLTELHTVGMALRRNPEATCTSNEWQLRARVTTNVTEYYSEWQNCIGVSSTQWSIFGFFFEGSRPDLSAGEELRNLRIEISGAGYGYVTNAFTTTDPGLGFQLDCGGSNPLCFPPDDDPVPVFPFLILGDDQPGEYPTTWSPSAFIGTNSPFAFSATLTPSTTESGYDYPELEGFCEDTFPTTGVFDLNWIPQSLCRVLSFLFVPSQSAFDSMFSSVDVLRSKFPFAYFYDFIDSFNGISFAGAGAPDPVQTQINLGAGNTNIKIFDPGFATTTLGMTTINTFRQLMSWATWLGFGFFCYFRIKGSFK